MKFLPDRMSGDVLQAATRRHFFKQCGVGLGSVALTSLLNEGRASAKDAVREPEPGTSYVRVSSIVLPTYCWIPGASKSVHTYIPIDDTHSWRFDFGFKRARKITDGDVHRRLVIDKNYNRIPNKENHFQIEHPTISSSPRYYRLVTPKL